MQNIVGLAAQVQNTLSTPPPMNSSLTRSQTIFQAQEIIKDMHAAGFTDDQIQDGRIAETVVQLCYEDRSLLYPAALAARLLVPE